MSALEQLLRREKTGRDLRSVVSVMKSLSADAIEQYDAAVGAMLHYHGVVDLGLQAVLRKAMLRTRATLSPEAASVFIFIGSDRGLCGQFNETVAALAALQVEAEERRSTSALFLIVGARTEARLQARGFAPVAAAPVPSAADAIGETVEAILMWLDEQRERHEIGNVRVIYNRRTGEKLAEARDETILPVTEDRLARIRKWEWPSRGLPIFTAEADELFSKLVPELVFLSLFRAVGESLASEHASRLAAMQRAERYIEEYLATLNAEIREQRQNSITQQLLDIVASYNIMQERELAAFE